MNKTLKLIEFEHIMLLFSGTFVTLFLIYSHKIRTLFSFSDFSPVNYNFIQVILQLHTCILHFWTLILVLVLRDIAHLDSNFRSL